ncbi:hypothetical protein L1887_33356 [Cichorium endivia]|nr:hypothetical protein L1887_33356 [Cichorium endivia]
MSHSRMNRFHMGSSTLLCHLQSVSVIWSSYQVFVWMSHGDEAVKLPDGHEVVAMNEQGAVAAVENLNKRIQRSQP